MKNTKAKCPRKSFFFATWAIFCLVAPQHYVSMCLRISSKSFFSNSAAFIPPVFKHDNHSAVISTGKC